MYQLAAEAQTHILFQQLNTSHGLSDNYVYAMATDKNGMLWVGTGEGLNLFNGKAVTKFFKSDHPEMGNDYVYEIICDKDNRLWMHAGFDHYFVIDQNRHFHALPLTASPVESKRSDMAYCENTGIIFLEKGKQYILSDQSKIENMGTVINRNLLQPLLMQGDSVLFKKELLGSLPIDSSQVLFYNKDAVFLANYQNKKIMMQADCPGITSPTLTTSKEVIYYSNADHQFHILNTVSGKSSLAWQDLKDQFQQPIANGIRQISRTADGLFVFSSSHNGIYTYNPLSQQLYNHHHEPADPFSLATNSTYNIFSDANGWVFVSATPNGVSFFNSRAAIKQQTIFRDAAGKQYDGYISSIARESNGRFLIGTFNRLIEWNRSNGATKFLDYGVIDGKQLDGNESITMLATDKNDNIWVGTRNNGIVILNKQRQPVRYLQAYVDGNSLPGEWITHMVPFGKDSMMVSSNRGICLVNIHDFKIDRFEGRPLHKTKNMFCYRTWFDDKKFLWIATADHEALRYNTKSGELKEFVVNSSPLYKSAFCFNKDDRGNVYVGCNTGLCIIRPNDSMQKITTANGLLNKRVEALLLDKAGNMWMGNDVGLACYDTHSGKLSVFDERYGLSVYGFKLNAYYQDADDELVWGTEKGIQFFYPGDLLNQKINLNSTINKVQAGESEFNLTQNASITLPYRENFASIYFSSADFSTYLRTFYRYKLEGLNKNWTEVVDQQSVRYSSLPPGSYHFLLQASNDGKNWKDATNSVELKIKAPWWQSPIFLIPAVALIGFLIWRIIRNYRRKQAARREALEVELVINYFATSIYSHQKEEEVLWKVAQNCIGRLHFEDCVIYLLDEEKQVLVQKAAHGPKEKREGEIDQPITIPLGQGIVGSVALSGKAEIVNDTTKDARYIVDDKRRYSEITIPIQFEGKVLGIIDCEHSRKHFFTNKHLNILSTVAYHCANHLMRARQEAEKQKVQIELLQNKQKATEAKLQSMRLQMNPHFLFNALNSIQQMILSGEEVVATRYLSKFSKLLRMVLINSDKEQVSLQQEIEILILYAELESIRFKGSFSFDIICDEDIDPEEVMTPTLLVQPLVENAIWHGLMHKQGHRYLLIHFSEDENGLLQCVVEDNGVGREAAKAMGNGATKHTGKGISVTAERLQTLSEHLKLEDSFTVVDLKDAKGNATGTRVIIKLPVLN